ncbi:MAG: hypothetical protein V3S72_04860 [Desulfobacterales bacterium]
MKKTVQLTFLILIIFCLSLFVSSCSYMKMTYQKKKDELRHKISPSAGHEKPAVKDGNHINTQSAPLQTSHFKNLDNHIFSAEYGELGLYFPENFMERFKYRFYVLDEDPEGKIPVVFVHGISGTPANWKYIVENIDRDHFSPVFYYYPTGIRLNNAAELLYKGLKAIHKRHGQIIVIAHSMGGLVSRGVMRRFALDRLEGYIPLYISLSTPYGGHEHAQKAVDHILDAGVVPSWRDVASESKYIRELYDPPLSPGTDFHLIFGYKNPRRFRIGSNSDGAITIKSQLDPRAQREALRIYGVDEDHVTILGNSEVASILNELLQEALQRINRGAS